MFEQPNLAGRTLDVGFVAKPSKESATTKKDIHVVPHNGGWATRKEGAQRVGHTADTQKQAFEQAREQAEREHVEVVIHRPDGTIRNSNSYGNDPHPPIDKKH